MRHNDKPVEVLIHEAIHRSNCNNVRIGGKSYPIERHDQTGCRFVQLGDVVVMEQRKTPNTSLGRRALEGECLSWAIPKDHSQDWRLIESNRAR